MGRESWAPGLAFWKAISSFFKDSCHVIEMEVDQGHLLLAMLEQKDSLKDTSYFGLNWCGLQPARDEVLIRLLKDYFQEEEETKNAATLEPSLAESLCEGLSLDLVLKESDLPHGVPSGSATQWSGVLSDPRGPLPDGQACRKTLNREDFADYFAVSFLGVWVANFFWTCKTGIIFQILDETQWILDV